MTPTEINRRLALVIGHEQKDVHVGPDGAVYVYFLGGWCRFDYRHASTIYPIAEKYKLMPEPTWDSMSWAIFLKAGSPVRNTSPRACVALAVIEAKERGLI